MKVAIYTDGSTVKHNPGPSGIGAVILNSAKQELARISEFIGEATNNEAEYQAAITSVKKAKELGAAEVSLYTDSQLMQRQFTGAYSVNNDRILPLYFELVNLSREFRIFEMNHLGREHNNLADSLANSAARRGHN